MTNDDIIATLNPQAASCARTFLEKFPLAELTSGLRDLNEQAAAMAKNIYEARANGKDYLSVYISSEPIREIEDWTGSHPNALTSDIAEAIVDILDQYSTSALRYVSWHLTGDAFDVQPDGDQNKVDYLRDLVNQRCEQGGAGRFLTTESGLVRWHLQLI